MSLKDIAEKVAKSKAAGVGNYFRDGKGLVMVVGNRYEPGGFKGEKFIAELRVIESQSLESAKDKEGKQILANEPGTTVTYMQIFEGNTKDVAFPNTKAYCLALWGEDEQKITPEDFAKAFNDMCAVQQPMKGALLRYETARKVAKASQKEIVVLRFEHVPGQTAESIAKNRAWLETVQKQEAPADGK